jgi:hypothetical protein
MFRGDWHNELKAGGIILAVLIAAVCWTAYFGEQQGQRYQPNGEHASQNSRLHNPRLYEPDCKVPKDNDEADLCAQREMAAAAWKVVEINWFQIALSALSLAAIYFTFRETRRASNAAVAAAQHSARQADLAETAFRNLERPHLFQVLEMLSTTRYKQSLEHAQVWLKNYGKVPGIIEDASIVLMLCEECPMAAVESAFQGRLRGIIIAGGDQNESLPVNLSHRAHTPLAKYWICGVVRYSDPQGSLYWKEFCYVRETGQSQRTILFEPDANRTGTGEYPGASEKYSRQPFSDSA